LGLTSTGPNPVFPNILYNYSTAYVINAININSAHKSLNFNIILTKKNLFLLKIFKKINFIRNFLIYKNNKLNKLFIKIYPYYFKNLKIVKTFKLISTPSRTFYISLKALQFLSQRSGCSIYLLSTNKGILTHNEAINFKISGYLLGYFYL
jgi:ribosomal protein S8